MNNPNKIKEKEDLNSNRQEEESQGNYKEDDNMTKIDLTNVDATEDSMEAYTFPKEFLKLDLDKIREFIEILEEYYQTCLKEDNISLSKSVKQRIILLNKLEKEKMKIEANIIYSNQRELVQDKMQEELENYINTTNQEFDSLLQAFESQEEQMVKNHEQEIEEFKKEFTKLYDNRKPKPSRECLNWMKIREYAMKLNKFNKADEAEKEINRLMEKDMKKFNEEKEKKLKNELKKITNRHENEKNGLIQKKNNIIDMFNQTKEKNIEQIQRKYEAKLKELKNYQNFEMANFDKITKGIAKPSTRIQNIVSSTTGYKDDEEEEEEGEENEKEQGTKDENIEEKKNEENHNEDNEEKNDEENKEGNEEEQMHENDGEDKIQENEGEDKIQENEGEDKIQENEDEDEHNDENGEEHIQENEEDEQ